MPYCSPPPGGDSSVCTLPLGNLLCMSLYIIDFKHLCVVYVNVKLLPRDCFMVLWVTHLIQTRTNS